MITLDYLKKFKNKRLVVGLGYFDSVHKGHAMLIREVERLAKELDAVPSIFTFINNPFEVIGRDTKNIFSFEERKRRLDNLNVQVVIGAKVTPSFLEMSDREFLDILRDNFDIVGFVSGTDYTYGKDIRGNATTLVDYGKANNIKVSIVDLAMQNGHKISSRDIRDLLISGQIDKVNTLLSEPYSVVGKVNIGRGDGSKIGFPTANIDIDKNILLLKRGVYATIVIVDGKRYRAVTNFGGHPTFNDNSENIEPHILDFDGNIYGKEIEIVFLKYLREVKKFNSIEELKNTISQNEQTTRDEVEL